MTSRTKWQFGADAFVLTIFATAFLTSRDFPDKARLFPTVVLIAGLAFALVRIVQDVLADKRGEQANVATGVDLQADASLTQIEALQKAAPQFAWVFAAVGAAALFGILPVLPLFIVCHMRFSGGETWKTAVGSAIGFTVFLLVVFEVLLNTFWPQGLFPWPQNLMLGTIEGIVDAWL